MILKPINGTWFEFRHHCTAEGVFWNDTCANFTDAQWEAKVDEIAALGMKYIVLMSSSLVYDGNAVSYFKNDIFQFAPIAASDPIGALLRAAQRNNIKVFMSCGFYGEWTETINNMTSSVVQKRAFNAMEQLVALYGKYESFYGWYLPDESDIKPYFSDEFVNYINAYSKFAKSIVPGSKVLIAPYGTNHLKTDDKYISQIESIDVDIIAYQDEVGVQKATPDETPRFYEALRKAHDKAGRSALWADMELFEFTGKVYQSALKAAPFERIERQIKSISPFVDEILVYQYQGMMNSPESKAFCGHPDSLKLYNDYKAWLEKLK
ncbi:MAG: DUF4434 domain-containing protein [Ruminococcaceae bacterium]|nr:DUF4434 domain-containing protein [Oscillospiraceae bacterium]